MATVLVLVDTGVREHEKLLSGLKPGVTPVLFDKNTDSISDIINRIPDGEYSIAGIIQDGTEIGVGYSIVTNQQSADYADNTTWTDIRYLLTSLQAKGVATVDFISCMLFANAGFADMITQLESELSINLRASRDMTGNLSVGGNWIQESDNVNIKDIYFTDEINNYSHLLYSYLSSMNQSPTLNVKADGSNADWCMTTPAKKALNPLFFSVSDGLSGSIKTWGYNNYGEAFVFTGKKYTAVSSAIGFALAALDTSGNITWRNSTTETVITAPVGAKYVSLTPSYYSFAALDSSGNIYAFGHPINGTQYGAIGAVPGTGYTAICAMSDRFAALKSDGSIYVWGGSTSPATINNAVYTAIVCNYYEFAALDSSGNICTINNGTIPETIVKPAGSSYVAITSTMNSFAALDSSRNITWWFTNNNDNNIPALNTVTGTGYVSIVSNNYAYAALKADGSIFSWGSSIHGGGVVIPGTGYKAITSTNNSFAAITATGAVKYWKSSPVDVAGSGYTAIAAAFDRYALLDSSSNVWSYAPGSAPVKITGTGYTAITSSFSFFTAIDASGGVYAWSHQSGVSTLAPVPSAKEFITVGGTNSGFMGIKTLSIDTTLSSFIVNGAPVTNGSTVSLNAGTSGVTVDAIATSSYATCAIVGGSNLATLNNRQAGTVYGLVTGDNTLTVRVTAEDGTVAINTVTLRVRSTVTSLSTFTVNGRAVINGSTVDLSGGTADVAIVATPTSSSATVAITGGTNLVNGINPLYVSVTAENGNTQIYTVTLRVKSAVTTLSTFTVNGRPVVNESIVDLSAGITFVTVVANTTSPSASRGITGATGLATGNNTLTVRVTAEDGTVAVNTVTLRVLSPPPTAPSIRLISCSTSSITIGITPPVSSATPVLSYTVLYKLLDETTYIPVPNIDVGTSQYPITGLTSGSYTVVVKSVNGSLSSNASNTVKGIVLTSNQTLGASLTNMSSLASAATGSLSEKQEAKIAMITAFHSVAGTNIAGAIPDSMSLTGNMLNTLLDEGIAQAGVLASNPVALAAKAGNILNLPSSLTATPYYVPTEVDEYVILRDNSGNNSTKIMTVLDNGVKKVQVTAMATSTMKSVGLGKFVMIAGELRVIAGFGSVLTAAAQPPILSSPIFGSNYVSFTINANQLTGADLTDVKYNLYVYTADGATLLSTTQTIGTADVLTSVTFNGLMGGQSYKFAAAITTFDGSGVGPVTTLQDSYTISTPICFLADAPVLTPSGYRPISSFKVGDKVLTADGRQATVRSTYAKRYLASAATNPYVIPKGTLGAMESLPISPNHEVLVPGKGMIKAKHLGLRQMAMKKSFMYYNLELDDWVSDNMVVAGVTVESLAPTKRITMSREEYADFVYNRYGTPTADTLARIKQVFYRLEDGRVSAPVFASK